MYVRNEKPKLKPLKYDFVVQFFLKTYVINFFLFYNPITRCPVKNSVIFSSLMVSLLLEVTQESTVDDQMSTTFS